MSWWTEKAAHLQRVVKYDESSQDGYSRDAESRSIVHARQDIILLVSLMDTAIGFLLAITIALFLLVGLTAACVAKFFGYL